MKDFLKFLKKYKIEILYSIILVFILVFLGLLFSKPSTQAFFTNLEAKTFDIRQILSADSKKVNKDIVIVTVDDSSYEYLLSHYGEWPIPRSVYADFVNYVEAQKPIAVAFDLLFIKSLKADGESDKKLVDTFKKYDNLYTAINFDDQTKDLRLPPVLPKSLTADMDIKSKKFDPYKFSNCRAIMSEITDVTDNVGHINTPKAEDGVHRAAPLFVKYPRYNNVALKYGITEYSSIDYYPNLTLKVALKYLKEKENLNVDKITVDSDNNLILGKRKIKMLPDSSVILNWYGDSGAFQNNTFTYVPFWKIIESLNAKKKGTAPILADGFFKDKVVYLGTSVMSLSDIKMVPTGKYFPGVEIHTTLLNNIIDNNIITKAPAIVNIAAILFLIVIVASAVYFVRSILASLVISAGISVFYLIFAYYLMKFFKIWIWIAIPMIAILFTFIIVYLIKYIMKSRDLEYTYKLATTDGLTELYNHRFFQEQMIMNIDYAKRANHSFSLILIDIDFFKKFNDTYGHQAGDAVLKQVAQTLKKTVRVSDIVCRYGGEEMSIILRNVNNEEAIFTANKICDVVRNTPFNLGNNIEKQVTISLGVSTFPMDGDTPAELIEHADKGLYIAKENGRNQVGVAHK